MKSGEGENKKITNIEQKKKVLNEEEMGRKKEMERHSIKIYKLG